VLLVDVAELLECVDARGISPFAEWRERLDPTTRARVTTAIFRLESGNFSAVKGVGAGVFELRLDFGPGYRVYFGKDGEQLVVLLGGGTKKRQQADLVAAQALWQQYKRTKIRRESDGHDKKV
jgi:putative addiction module killer protein